MLNLKKEEEKSLDIDSIFFLFYLSLLYLLVRSGMLKPVCHLSHTGVPKCLLDAAEPLSVSSSSFLLWQLSLPIKATCTHMRGFSKIVDASGHQWLHCVTS